MSPNPKCLDHPCMFSHIKVHLDMCTQLLRLIDKISSIFPRIEAARPHCSAGLHALCQLQTEMDKSRTLVQTCCDSSKLYLALTADAVLSRFERKRTILQQSLSELQNMVPVALSLEMSGILDDLRDADFFIDSHEDEAGKALRALLQQDTTNSFGTSELEVLQFAAVRLNISTQKDFLIERRSIRKLLAEVEEGNSKKRASLKYFFHLLKKYEKQIVQGQTMNPPAKDDSSRSLVKSNKKSVTTDSINSDSRPLYTQNNAWTRVIHGCGPPDEFICPLSLRLMNDPVIISSGQTFERTFIQKWFDEGNDTCPRTKVKLTNLSLTPNTSMRDLILKWSTEQQPLACFSTDPSKQTSSIGSRETSSNSIRSTASSMNGIHLQIDISNLSLGSLDSNYSSSFFHSKVQKGYSSLRPSEIESRGFQFFQSVHDIESEFLSNASGLPWESLCKAVPDVKDYLVNFNPSFTLLSSENFMRPLVQFLKDALDRYDLKAQRDGIELLLVFLKSDRMEAVQPSEDLYAVLASFIGTETEAEALSIMEILSTQNGAISKFVTSSSRNSTIKLLSNHNCEFTRAVIRILYNLSFSMDTSSSDLASEWIPKLVPFLKDTSVSSTCLSIMENLCKFEAGRIAIGGADGCIRSIVELLKSDNCEDQENAVGILLSLCSQKDYYCDLVLHENAIPSLEHMSENGTERSQFSASELLRLLRYQDKDECPKDCEDKKSSRTSRGLGKKMMVFLRRK